MRTFIAAALLATVSAPSLAATYVGADYSYGIYDEQGFETVNPGSIRVRLGTDFTPYVGMELHGSFGVQDDSTNYYGYDIDLKVKSTAGVYAKLQAPLTSTLSVYGLAGYATAKFKAEIDSLGIESEGDASGFSYGAGLDCKLGSRLHLIADYTRIADDDGVTFDAASAGFRWDLD